MGRPKIDRKELKMHIADILYEFHKDNKLIETCSLQHIRDRLEKKHGRNDAKSLNLIKELKKAAIEHCLDISVKLKFVRNEELEKKIKNKFNPKSQHEEKRNESDPKGLEEVIVVDV